MTSLFNKLFLFPISPIFEDTVNTGGGLISPYSLPQKDITALAIDEMESESRQIGYAISNAYRQCSPSINLIKKVDPAGFLEFKSRVTDTLNLNNILSDNSSLKDQLAEIFACAYAEVSRSDRFLVFKDLAIASKTATAILAVAKRSGLRLPSTKTATLLKNVLITVLNVPEPKKNEPAK